MYQWRTDILLAQRWGNDIVLKSTPGSLLRSSRIVVDTVRISLRRLSISVLVLNLVRVEWRILVLLLAVLLLAILLLAVLLLLWLLMVVLGGILVVLGGILVLLGWVLLGRTVAQVLLLSLRVRGGASAVAAAAAAL